MVELLIATLNCKNYEKLLNEMNVETNAVISNQIDKVGHEIKIYKNNEINIYTMNSTGVGLNRNNCLFNSSSKITLLADDDMRYVNNYSQIVKDTFKSNPGADVIIFNLDEKNGTRFKIKKNIKINYWNYTKFGAARIAFKRDSILKKRISFSLLFGGGAKYSAGEDTLFLKDCLDSNLNIIGVPITIASLDENSESTWFNGYNEKLLKDLGACYSEIFKFTFFIRTFYYCFKRREELLKNNISLFKSIKLVYQGSREFRLR